ncbi:MAG: hypothetical protein HFH31_01095 [Bacilli bacterium]|nr:hypothetical protein [Bacilli bacterium]
MMVDINYSISVNGKKMKVIAYFMFESSRDHYIIYCKPRNNDSIYLGRVLQKEGKLVITQVDKAASFLMKKFIKELTEKNLETVKCYRYFNKLSKLKGKEDVIYIDSQEIKIDKEKKKNIEEFIKEINIHNKEILAKATEEYYLQLVDEKAKERKTIIILLAIIIIIVSIIVKMLIDFSRFF